MIPRRTIRGNDSRDSQTYSRRSRTIRTIAADVSIMGREETALIKGGPLPPSCASNKSSGLRLRARINDHAEPSSVSLVEYRRRDLVAAIVLFRVRYNGTDTSACLSEAGIMALFLDRARSAHSRRDRGAYDTHVRLSHREEPEERAGFTISFSKARSRSRVSLPRDPPFRNSNNVAGPSQRISR